MDNQIKTIISSSSISESLLQLKEMILNNQWSSLRYLTQEHTSEDEETDNQKIMQLRSHLSTLIHTRCGRYEDAMIYCLSQGFIDMCYVLIKLKMQINYKHINFASEYSYLRLTQVLLRVQSIQQRNNSKQIRGMDKMHEEAYKKCLSAEELIKFTSQQMFIYN